MCRAIVWLVPSLDFLPIEYDMSARTGVAFDFLVNVDVITSAEAAAYGVQIQVKNPALITILTIPGTVTAAADLTNSVDLTFFKGATYMIGPAGEYVYEMRLQHKIDVDDNYAILAGDFKYEQGLIT